METTTQPSTIGEMSPEHFQAYITAIIKHVTDERFDRIEKRLDKIDIRLDKIEIRLDRLEEKVDRLEDKVNQLENKFDQLSRNQDLMGALVLEHDNRLRNMVAA